MTYKIIKQSTLWLTNSLKKKVEQILNEKTKEGYKFGDCVGVDKWDVYDAYWFGYSKNYN